MKLVQYFIVFIVPSSVVIGSSETDLVKLQQEFSDWLFSENPQFSTSINIHKYDDQVDDYSVDIFDRWKNSVENYKQRLMKISRNTLPEKFEVQYDIFDNFLTTYIDGNKWRDYNSLNPLNFLEGPHIDPDYLVGITPKNTRGDFENFISRIQKMPNQLQQMKTRFEKAKQLHHTYHNVSIFKVPKQIESRITSRPEDFSFYSPFNEILDNITSINTAEKQNLRSRAKQAIGTYFEGLRDIKHYLETDYFNHLRQGFGVNSWANGAEFYKSVLQWHLSLPLSPEEVHQKGLDEVERISKEMQKIMSKLGYSGTVKQVFDTIKNESRFYLKTGDQILKRFNTIIHQQIEPKLKELFKNLPNLPVEVKPMPNDGPGGQYFAGSADGTRPGVFQVNLMHPDEMITIDFMALALHETNPGHHLQISIQQLADSPDYLRYSIDEKYFQAPALFPFYTAFVEGWALYAESLGEEVGLYADDYDLLGRYGSEIFRACRLVVDTGLHYMNWTRQEAIDYMLNYTAYGESDITTEINRYLTWPGQACAYKIGELKIKELRQRATSELGDLFDLKDFHSIVLENGAIPLSSLETIVDGWIEKTKSDHARTSEHPNDDLEKLQEDFSDWLLSQNPEVARSINIHKYDDDIRDYSFSAFDYLKENVDKYLRKLELIPRSALTEKNRVDYDIFKDTLNTYHNGYNWRKYAALNPINFLEGPQGGNSYDVSILPKNMTLKDYESFITRIGKYPKQIMDYKTSMEMAINEGHTNHNVSMFRVPPRFKDLNLTSPSENYSLYEPFLERLDNVSSIDDVKKADLRRRAKDVIKKYLDSLVEISHFVENVYMKHLRKGYGVSSWDNGSEFYKQSLQWHLSLPLTPEEVHMKGLSEVKRISAEMQKIFRKLNMTGTVKEVFDKLKKDPRFLLNNSEEMIKAYDDIIHQRVQPHIKKLFKDVPDLPVVVKRTSTDGIGGSYLSGAPDGSRPGIFYVNTFHPDESPTFNFVDLALHETVPGHHLQLSYQITAKIPGFRQWGGTDPFYMIPAAFPMYTAFIEGWALYAESLGEEMGVYHDDYELLGRYSAEIFRACRLVVDTGIHYFNWTDERAINYMLNYTANGESDITTEVYRYVTWPGQACAYKIGELKIRELRNKAENILGSKFDIRDFHLTVLQNGAMPLTTLETVVDAWVEQVKNSGNKPDETPLEKLIRLQKDFSEWLLYENPEFATSINDRRYDDRLDDYSLELFDRWKKTVDNYLKQLESIPRESLSSKHKVDYDIFKDFLQTYHNGYQWRMYNALNPVNFLEGPQVDPDSFVKQTPKHTKGDFENLITRIHNMPEQLEEMKRRFIKAIEVNHTYHHVSVDAVSARIDEILTSDPENFAYYVPFKNALDKISTIDNAEKETIRSRAKMAISNFQNSLIDMKRFINETYVQHTRPGYGVGSWNNGKEFYKACLRWHTSLPLSPDEVHNMGLSEVKRISTEMKKIFRRLGISGSVKNGFDTLKNDSKYFLKTSDEILSAFNDLIHGKIQPKLGTLFKDIPDIPVVVEKMPYNGPLGMYSNGSPDGSKPGTFHVNVLYPDQFSTITFRPLALHETIPGHHLQISIQLTSNVAGFRRNGLDSKYFQPPALFPFYTAFVEGWALYAEYLGEEMGIYETDAEMLGRYSEEIYRACRLVVDTGIHYFGWSRERAIEYMSNYTASGIKELTTEIDRYITWPGQACAYKIGEMKIKDLRKKAHSQLGSKFDVKEFHSVVLSNGPMPLTTLETVVDNWIKDVKQHTPVTESPNTNDGTNLQTNYLIHFISFSLLVKTFY